MPLTIKCAKCNVALNLPPEAKGRRVKCPKCGEKFRVGENAAAESASGPGLSGEVDRPSTLELSRPGEIPGDLPLSPLAGGDLRETFSLPMMTGEADKASVPPGAADVSALFKDDPAPRKRKRGAEGRATARRCTSCGGFVAAGMSICQSCGLDLDTGQRVDLMDDLVPTPVVAKPTMPIGVAVVGTISAGVAFAMAVFALVLHLGGTGGAIYFFPVAAFGIYASVQFLRGKSAKLLIIALTLGAMVDLFALVVVPIYQANSEVVVTTAAKNPENPDLEAAIIHSPVDRLDTGRIATGFVVLAVYALISVYLLSPQVNRYVRRSSDR